MTITVARGIMAALPTKKNPKLGSGKPKNREGGAAGNVLVPRRVASLRSLFHRLSAEGRWSSMNTQIFNKGGFANNFWVQMAALVIVTLVVIALAAKYVWWPLHRLDWNLLR
jgi:hypothetical protein